MICGRLKRFSLIHPLLLCYAEVALLKIERGLLLFV